MNFPIVVFLRGGIPMYMHGAIVFYTKISLGNLDIMQT